MALKVWVVSYIIAQQEINIANLLDDYLEIHWTQKHTGLNKDAGLWC